MTELDIIIWRESHKEFYNRLLILAETDYKTQEAWLLLKIKELIKMRLEGLE